ncbi:hypothetical protein NW760_010670 [Fusarium oxysporum]|nr:hypothetical protein NW769_009687 [Fusarium oxysporum]KAJ4222983.1 hypothetical protein NW760_010670 [Fusarium oxysporum]
MPFETLPDTPRASFLGLPLEIRQHVYLEYFTIEGGYTYDAETDRLVQASLFAIDLSLRYVCRMIALETYHCPFTLNTITFSTAYRQDWRKQAAIFDFITTYHFRLQLAMLDRLRHCLTPDMYETPSHQYSRYISAIAKKTSDTIALENRHPNFNMDSYAKHIMEDFKEGRGIKFDGGDLSKVSVFDNNISSKRTYTYLLRQIANRYPEKFREAIDDLLPGWSKSKSRSAFDFFNLGFDFWAIPTLPEVTDMVEQLQLRERWDQLDLWRYNEGFEEGYTGTRSCYQRKHFFSAAALAIRFLKGISQTHRLLITKLALNEDRMAVGNPECHVIGLIAFVEENPKLFIEHRVNLWRNIIPKGCGTELSGFPTQNESDTDHGEGVPHPHQVHSQWASNAISHFIMHTLESLREGLPPNSYSFIFDGEPELSYSTETFRYLTDVQIAWMTANTDCVARGVLASPESKNYPFTTYPSTGETASVQERSSIIQCNFTLDQPWDYKSIAGDNSENIYGWGSVDEIMRDPDTDDEFDNFYVSNGNVDWMQIKGEYFEMQSRSDLSEVETKALHYGHLKE